MLRLIVRSVDCGAACHVGGPVATKFATFDIDAPEVEQYLKGAEKYEDREVIGVFGLSAAGVEVSDGE